MASTTKRMRTSVMVAVGAICLFVLTTCRSDATGPSAGGAARQAYLRMLQDTDFLNSELDGMSWADQGTEGIAAAVWLSTRTRALGLLVSAIGTPDHATYMTLLRELDAMLKRIGRLQGNVAQRFQLPLHSIGVGAETLRGVLLQDIAPLLPAIAEADAGARMEFATSRTFVAHGNEIAPTDETQPVLAVGNLDIDATCFDVQGGALTTPAVLLRDAVSLRTLGTGQGGTAAVLDQPSWVTVSILSVGAFAAVRCELVMAGTRPGVAGTPLTANQVGTLQQQLDALELQLDMHDLEIAEQANSATAPATRALFRELAHRAKARREFAGHLRLFTALGTRSEDEKQIASRERQLADAELDDAEAEAEDADGDAREQYQQAVRILEEQTERQTQAVQTLSN